MVLWAPNDMNIPRHFATKCQSDHLRDLSMKRVDAVESYLSTKKCRREKLLQYFSSSDSTTSELSRTKTCCDNCSKNFKDDFDLFLGEKGSQLDANEYYYAPSSRDEDFGNEAR